MPSKKRKYNARFPAGRIKKIMQTDEEVGKVAQAVPIIISRTLELFVESLLGKAMQVTAARNAKTLSPSHVKQCILAEARFDFLRDLVKNIPDVSAAEEKEMMSAENSPNTSRFPDAAPRRVVREDSNSSGSTDVRPQPNSTYSNTKEQLKRVLSENEKTKIKDTPSTSLVIDQAALLNIPPIVTPKVTETNIDSSSETAIDLSTNSRPIRSANFYQETLITETVPHNSVIKINPIYSTSQPSTSFTSLNPVEPRKVDVTPKTFDLTPKTFDVAAKAFDVTAKKFDVTPLTAKTFDVRPKAFDLTPKTFDVPPKTFERHNSLPRTPVTPITPVINIDFSKNLSKPEIKVLDATAAVANVKNETKGKISRQNSKPKIEIKNKTPSTPQPIVDIDSLNSGNPQIDEDYDT